MKISVFNRYYYCTWVVISSNLLRHSCLCLSMFALSSAWRARWDILNARVMKIKHSVSCNLTCTAAPALCRPCSASDLYSPITSLHCCIYCTWKSYLCPSSCDKRFHLMRSHCKLRETLFSRRWRLRRNHPERCDNTLHTMMSPIRKEESVKTNNSVKQNLYKWKNKRTLTDLSPPGV